LLAEDEPDPWNWTNLGVCYFYLGDLDDAKEAAKKGTFSVPSALATMRQETGPMHCIGCASLQAIPDVWVVVEE
jgi:hypothetical protein